MLWFGSTSFFVHNVLTTPSFPQDFHDSILRSKAWRIPFNNLSLSIQQDLFLFASCCAVPLVWLVVSRDYTTKGSHRKKWEFHDVFKRCLQLSRDRALTSTTYAITVTTNSPRWYTNESAIIPKAASIGRAVSCRVWQWCLGPLLRRWGCVFVMNTLRWLMSMMGCIIRSSCQRSKVHVFNVGVRWSWAGVCWRCQGNASSTCCFRTPFPVSDNVDQLVEKIYYLEKKLSSLSSFLQVFVQLHSSKQGPMTAKRRCFLTSGCLVAELVPPIPLLQGVFLRLVHPESSVCASAVFILCQDVPIIVSCPTGARLTSWPAFCSDEQSSEDLATAVWLFDCRQWYKRIGLWFERCSMRRWIQGSPLIGEKRRQQSPMSVLVADLCNLVHHSGGLHVFLNVCPFLKKSNERIYQLIRAVRFLLFCVLPLSGNTGWQEEEGFWSSCWRHT